MKSPWILQGLLLAAVLVSTVGLTQCSATCYDFDSEGNRFEYACVICRESDENPCTGDRWDLEPGGTCSLDQQPILPNGTPCDDGNVIGVCSSGVCAISATCGDGNLDPGEGCDLGSENGIGEGKCLPDCSGFQTCGDGSATGDETCDDGANDGGPGECLDCTDFQVCGDMMVTGTEVCESNNAVPCDTLGAFVGGTASCNATCEAYDTSACTTSNDCGNGVTDPGEACDDGENDGGDGECLACASIQTCGDGATEGTEACDDGASNDSGPGFCVDGCTGVQTCGDGVPNGTEACDDGAALNGSGEDVCLADCSGTQECGNGVPETAPNGTEACDDGVNDGGEGECLACAVVQQCGDGQQEVTEFCELGDTTECTALGGGFLGGTADCNTTCSAWDTSACTTSFDCGNGVTDAGEACDDGILNGTGDGQCLGDCSGVQDCGDGVQNGSEQCDDGLSNGSGPGACIATCERVQSCGDSQADLPPIGTEACDDGFNNGGDGECLPGCTKVQVCGDTDTDGGEVCDDGVNDGGENECLSCVSIQTCGDNVAEGTENCDDGAQNGLGDGFCLNDCSATQSCGDGTKNGSEFCEAGESTSCLGLGGGFLGGTAFCNGACDGWDSSTCTTSSDCGNGNVDPGEVCDDGENDGEDGECLACAGLQDCGDGNQEGTEACDDGGANGSGDGFCIDDCSAVQDCGDGDQEGTETCDSGANNGAGEGFCLADCSRVEDCGDGILDSPPNGTELCDDGVNDGGPGECLAGCQSVQTCGNGLPLEGDEFCEQGQSVSCLSLGAGFLGGTAPCNTQCTAWDTTGCTTEGDCGNSAVDYC